MSRHLISRTAACNQAGFTLIELLVALTLGLLIAGAAVAALLAARIGFNSVDASSQLRENARFASSLMERITDEAGFMNVSYNVYPVNPLAAPLRGYDNTAVPVLTNSAAEPTYPAGTGINGSDVLVVTFVGASNPATDGAPADGSMINCAGIAEPQAPASLATSIFHIVTSASGEPTLACTYRDPTTLQWSTVPLVSGVESMQLLYGTDNVTPGVLPPMPISSANADSVPDRYLRASELDVGGAYNADNWRRVRSIRVGLLLRGAPNSAADRNATAQTYNVLGAGFTKTADVGSSLPIVTADGRLRQQVIFTIHLRNTQNLQSLLQ